MAQVVVSVDEPVHFRYLAAGDLWLDDADADQITENGSVLLLSTELDDATVGDVANVAASHNSLEEPLGE